MNEVNKVQLSGYLGRDPEVKIFENGKRLAKFSMATTETYYTKKGDKVTNTQWNNVTVWGKLAEMVQAQLTKGTAVVVDGKLNSRNYVDKSGQKKYVTEIVAAEINAIPDDDEKD